jgi:hypothetical protein
MLIILAFLFMVLGITKFKEQDYLWSFTFTLLSTVIWYILAVSIMELEVPYEMFNATSGNIETGVHTYTSKVSPEMVYFFIMMAAINIIFTVLQVFVAVGSIFKKRKEYM